MFTGFLNNNTFPPSILERIVDVNSENGGVYRCQVISTAGTFEENYVLSIKGKFNPLLFKYLFMIETDFF